MASTRTNGFPALIARTLLVVIYLVSGAGKIANAEATQAFMASKGMPMVPILFVLAIVFELVGATLVIVGFKARLGATMLIIFTAIASIIFHDFWASPPAQLQDQLVQFLKNVGLIGGQLLVIAFGPGPLSIDARRRSASEVFPT